MQSKNFDFSNLSRIDVDDPSGKLIESDSLSPYITSRDLDKEQYNSNSCDASQQYVVEDSYLREDLEKIRNTECTENCFIDVEPNFFFYFNFEASFENDDFMQEDLKRILEQEYSQNHENSQLSSSDPNIELASREIMHHNEGVSNKITECTKKINRNLNLHNLRKLLMRMCLTVRKFVIKPMHNVNKIKMNNNCKLKFIEITNKREPILEKLIEIARSDTRFKEFNQKFNVTRPYFDEFFKYAKNLEFYNYFIDFLFSEDEENNFKTLTLGSISREKDSLEGSRFWAAYCHDSKSRNHYLKNNLMHSYFNKN